MTEGVFYIEENSCLLSSCSTIKYHHALLQKLPKPGNVGFISLANNSRTSMARTLIARLPRLFQTRSLVRRRKKSLGCRSGIILGDILYFYFETVYCVYSLESPQ